MASEEFFEHLKPLEAARLLFFVSAFSSADEVNTQRPRLCTKLVAANKSITSKSEALSIAKLIYKDSAVKEMASSLTDDEKKEILALSKKIDLTDLPDWRITTTRQAADSSNSKPDWKSELVQELKNLVLKCDEKKTTGAIQYAEKRRQNLLDKADVIHSGSKEKQDIQAVTLKDLGNRRPVSAKALGPWRKGIGFLMLPVGLPISVLSGLAFGLKPAYLKTAYDARVSHLNDRANKNISDEDFNNGKVRKNYFKYHVFIGRVLKNAFTGVVNGPKLEEPDGKSHKMARALGASATLGLTSLKGFRSESAAFHRQIKELDTFANNPELPNPAVAPLKAATKGTAVAVGLVTIFPVVLAMKGTGALLGYASNVLQAPWKYLTHDGPFDNGLTRAISRITDTQNEGALMKLQSDYNALLTKFQNQQIPFESASSTETSHSLNFGRNSENRSLKTPPRNTTLPESPKTISIDVFNTKKERQTFIGTFRNQNNDTSFNHR